MITPEDINDRNINQSCGKHRYPDKRAAQSAVKNIFNNRNKTKGRVRRHRPDPRKMRIYHCPACNGWHMTKD